MRPRIQPMPRADRSRELTVAFANIRPNENWVDRMTASMVNVRSTMIEPVRFRNSASRLPNQYPTDPPASNGRPATSTLPNTRLRNALVHPNSSTMPVSFVYAASGFRHQK
jgi:hypothetical protein